MLDFDGRCNRPDVARNVATGASFGRSTAEAVSRLGCQRAGPPARHSGGVWICRADFFSGGAPSEVSAASHFLHMGVVGLAPWQPLGCMRCPAFSVSKFAFGTPPRERVIFSHTLLHVHVYRVMTMSTCLMTKEPLTFPRKRRSCSLTLQVGTR